jgi:hypothetical protein
MFSAEIESVSRSNQQQQDWDGDASNAKTVCCGSYRYCREAKRAAPTRFAIWIFYASPKAAWCNRSIRFSGYLLRADPGPH